MYSLIRRWGSSNGFAVAAFGALGIPMVAGPPRCWSPTLEEIRSVGKSIGGLGSVSGVMCSHAGIVEMCGCLLFGGDRVERVLIDRAGITRSRGDINHNGASLFRPNCTTRPAFRFSNGCVKGIIRMIGESRLSSVLNFQLIYHALSHNSPDSFLRHTYQCTCHDHSSIQ